MPGSSLEKAYYTRRKELFEGRNGYSIILDSQDVAKLVSTSTSQL